MVNNVEQMKDKTVTLQHYTLAFILSSLLPAGVIYALWFHEPTILSGSLMYLSRPMVIVGSTIVSLWGLVVGVRLFLLIAPMDRK